jgi:hypothetical protein
MCYNAPVENDRPTVTRTPVCSHFVLLWAVESENGTCSSNTTVRQPNGH